MFMFCLCRKFALPSFVGVILLKIICLMKKHIRINIFGKVQNIGFKLFAMMLASKFNLTGNVTEIPGQITMEVEGDAVNIEIFIDKCKTRHTSAVIERFDIEELPLAYFEYFSIY